MLTSRRHKRAPVALALLAVFIAPADAQDSRPAPALGPQDPSGGRWRPILLKSGSQVPLAPPPAPGSWQEAAELWQLRALQPLRTKQTMASARFWDAGACLRWNEIARGLVIKHRTPPPMASRVYALVSAAQYDALVAAWHHKYRHERRAPAQVDRRIVPLVATPRLPVYPSEHGVVAGASAAVLAYLYPEEAAALAALAQQHQRSRLWAGASFPSDIAAGDKLGRIVAERVIAYAQTDGSDTLWTGTVPAGDGYWSGMDPLLPLWGTVRPWLMTGGDQFRPAPPPAYGSPEFLAALAEVRHISDTRTPEQLAIAQFWADGAGTYTPPGHWNRIACELLPGRRWSELRQARALCLLNLALMDAGICCWDAKYAYWLLRPSQADPGVTLPVGLPNFPSYTSGHSTFSGAAAGVLAYLFPDQGEALRALAEEASISRVYGGIHYRFDCDVGLEGGRSIAALAILRGETDGSP